MELGIQSAPTVTVTVTANVIIDWGVDKNSLDFSTVKLGQSKTLQVQVTNKGKSGTASFPLSYTTPSGDFSFDSTQTTCGSSLAAGSSCEIGIKFAPTAVGSRTGSFTINGGTISNNGSTTCANDSQTINLSGTGEGTPNLSIEKTADKASVSAADEVINYTITVKNTGNVDLTGVTVTDPFATGLKLTGGDTNSDTKLNPSETWTYTATHKVTQAEINAGNDLVNTAKVTTGQTTEQQAQATTTVNKTPGLTLAPSAWDFGDVVVGADSTSKSFTLTNSGNVAVSGISPQFSGDYTQTSTTCTVALNPNGTCDIAVTFKPIAKGTRPGSLKVNATASSTSIASNTATLTGKGVQGELSVITPTPPDSLDFNGVTVGASSSKPVSVKNTGDGPLTDIRPSTAAPFSVSGQCASLQAGQTCPLDVTFRPTSSGSATGTLSVSASDGSPQRQQRSVDLKGNGTQGQLKLDPSELDFEKVKVGTTSEPKTATLSNTGTGDLTSLTISTLSPPFKLTHDCPTTLVAPKPNEPSQCRITVTFTPTFTTSSGNATITATADSSGTPQTKELKVSGTGIQGVLSVSPNILNFATPLLKPSQAQPVTISNTGDASLDNLSISGPTNPAFKKTGGNCGASLAKKGDPGDSCQLSYVFSPSVTGPQSDTLTISATNNNPVTVTLNGNGTKPTAADYKNVLGSIAQQTGNPSVISTTNAIANLCGTTDNAQATADCQALYKAGVNNDPNTANALTEITPERARKAAQVQSNAGKYVLGDLSSRLLALRRGASGLSLSGLSFRSGDQTFSTSMLASLFKEKPQAEGGGASADQGVLFGDRRFGAFLSGSLMRGDKKRSSLESGYESKNYALTAGLDYRFTNQLALGMSASYLDSSSDFDNQGGNLDSNGYSLGLYGTYYGSEQWYLSFAGSWGRNSFDQLRNMTYGLEGEPLVSQGFKASFDGTTAALLLDSGYNFKLDDWSYGPRLGFTYVRANIDGFSESARAGAGSTWAVQMANTTQRSQLLNLGGEVQKPFSTGWGVVTPTLRLDWMHEFNKDPFTIAGNFVLDPAGTGFLIYGDKQDPDFFRLNLGATTTLTHGMSGFLNYNQSLGDSQFSSYALTLGVRGSF